MSLRRRAFLAALLSGGVGAATFTRASDYLDRFAPPSGGVWRAADRDLPDAVSSPHGDATLTYDDRGVPTVEADGEEALYFAVGYVHAADRLFQMDLVRRRMRGELSAVFGERTVEQDVFSRRLDYASAAEANWAAVRDTDAAPAMRAYADGVEAYRTDGALPLEFQLLDYEPAAWTPVDSMLVEKQIGWGLTGSFRTLRTAAAADAWGSDLAAETYPARLDHDYPILRNDTGTAGERPTAPTESRSGSPRGAVDAVATWGSAFEWPDGVGSNSWVVGPAHTDSGRPLLANDPHLTLLAPPVWYEMRQRAPGMRTAGVTFPGTPFVIIGENDAGAWGFTNAGADCVDFYTYETEGDQYRYGDEWRSFAERTETVRVADGDDREVTVRRTVHGPMLERAGQRVAVAWTGLQASRTSVAVREMNRSAGAGEFRAALRKFDHPTQNVVYADRDGNTLYWVTGHIPVRRTDGERVRGDQVFDGSAREGEWAGYEPYGVPDLDAGGFVPFAEKPHAVNPEYVGTANQRVVDDPAYYLSEAYASPFRGKRLYDRLDDRVASDDPVDFAFLRSLQRDVHDERAALFVPTILEARDGMSDRARAAADSLAGWDYRMTRDSRAALVFARFVDHYRRELFGAAIEDAGFDDAYYPRDWVVLTLPPDSPWFSDPPAGDPRERSAVVAAAMDAAAAEIAEEGWERYGDYNRTGVSHPFDLEFLNYPDLPMDGSADTLKNFRVGDSVGSSYRLLSRFDGPTRTVLPGGNDGDYFSDHYHDQFRDWARGRYHDLRPGTGGDPDVRFRGGEDGG